MNRWMIALRTVLRRLGITPVLASAMNRLGLFGGAEGYEERFSQVMLDDLEPGDIVWEIGANLGIYTTQFCERVGPQGKVYAFEPTPVCFDDLMKNCRGELEVNCECFQLAVGKESGSVEMVIADDPLGATHTVLTSGQQAANDNTISVEMVSGDDLVKERGLALPTFLKVDVEGSELDVFQGMTAALSDSGCRAVFCEVHFGLLAERGQPYASQEIEALLSRCGLTEQSWVDPSHLSAHRPRAS
jgi:FkbM family methyltransferase